MANPKFTDSDGNNGYVWDEYPTYPSDPGDLLTPMRFKTSILTHRRNGVIIGVVKVANKVGLWDLAFRYIDKDMYDRLVYFFDLGYFRFYPDSDLSAYYNVFAVNIEPEKHRGLTYSIEFSLEEVGF